MMSVDSWKNQSQSRSGRAAAEHQRFEEEHIGGGPRSGWGWCYSTDLAPPPAALRSVSHSEVYDVLHLGLLPGHVHGYCPRKPAEEHFIWRTTPHWQSKLPVIQAELAQRKHFFFLIWCFFFQTHKASALIPGTRLLCRRPSCCFQKARRWCWSVCTPWCLLRCRWCWCERCMYSFERLRSFKVKHE